MSRKRTRNHTARRRSSGKRRRVNELQQETEWDGMNRRKLYDLGFVPLETDNWGFTDLDRLFY